MSERTSSDVEESSSISPHEAEVEQDPPESKKHTASSGVPPGKSIVPPENVEGHLMQLKSKKQKAKREFTNTRRGLLVIMREGGTMEAADQQLWYLENVEQEIFALLTDMEELYLGANNNKAVSKVHDEMEDLNQEMRATTDGFDQFSTAYVASTASSSTSNSLDATAQPFMPSVTQSQEEKATPADSDSQQALESDTSSTGIRRGVSAAAETVHQEQWQPGQPSKQVDPALTRLSTTGSQSSVTQTSQTGAVTASSSVSMTTSSTGDGTSPRHVPAPVSAPLYTQAHTGISSSTDTRSSSARVALSTTSSRPALPAVRMSAVAQ
eukprot:scpid15407/ scgid23893/ 